VTGDLVLLQVKDIKTIEELPKMTEKILGKIKKRDVKKKKMGKEFGTRNQFYGS
jgi:hypothetical protein